MTFKVPEDLVSKNKKLMADFVLRCCHGDKKLAAHVEEQADAFERMCAEFREKLFSDRKPGEPLESYKKRTLEYCQTKANAVMNLEK